MQEGAEALGRRVIVDPLRLTPDAVRRGSAFAVGSVANLVLDDHPDATVLLSDADLLGEMRAALADGYLLALVPALRGLHVRRGSRVMWRAAVDVCAEAFLLTGGSLGREPEALGLAERLLAGAAPLSGPANYHVLEHDGGSETTRVRNTCCLYCKVGDGCCTTGPRITHEERLGRLVAR